MQCCHWIKWHFWAVLTADYACCDLSFGPGCWWEMWFLPVEMCPLFSGFVPSLFTSGQMWGVWKRSSRQLDWRQLPQPNPVALAVVEYENVLRWGVKTVERLGRNWIVFFKRDSQMFIPDRILHQLVKHHYVRLEWKTHITVLTGNETTTEASQ